MKKTLLLLLAGFLIPSIFIGCVKEPFGNVANETTSPLSASQTMTTSGGDINSSQENSSSNLTTFDYWASFNVSVATRYDNFMKRISTGDYHEILTHTISAEKLLLGYRYDPSSSYLILPFDYDNQYPPIELLRKTDYKHMYSIQKTDDGGLFYAFFVGMGVNQDVEQDAVLYNTVFIMKNLVKSDFDTIKVGDDIAKVETVDPAAIQWEHYATKYNLSPFKSEHLLKDGVLTIDFQKQGESYTVTNIQYYPDFKINVTFHFPDQAITSLDVTYDYSILPQDYPQ